MTTQEREILELLIAHIETDETYLPEQLPIARRIAFKLTPTIARLIRDEISIERRRKTVPTE